MKPLAWGITGGGHFLIETFEYFKKISETHKITTYLSAAGEEVLRIYGLRDELEKISRGSYHSEIFTDRNDGNSSVHAGRLARGVYSHLVIAPATANTIAKISLGIADTLVTNIAAQAFKGEIPVMVLPTDHPSVKSTKLPVTVDFNACKKCVKCPPEENCEYNAFYRIKGKGTINHILCTGCKECIEACIYDAVIYGEEIPLKIRKIDEENLQRLASQENVTILKNPEDILSVLEEKN